jgi:hypothetical protein
LLLAAILLVSCGSDEPASDAPEFCAQAAEHRDTILTPPLSNAAEVAATLEFYRLMGELAPVAIAEQWSDLVTNLETAAALVPGDPESEQLVAMTAYATEPSAYAVKKWLAQNCGVDLPITTIAPQEQIPARTTTTTLGTVETSQPG